jgi:hypothetical protein
MSTSALSILRAATEPAPSTRTPSQAYEDLISELRHRKLSFHQGAYSIVVELEMFPRITVKSTAWENPEYNVSTGIFISRSARGTYPKLKDVYNQNRYQNIPGDIHRGVNSWQDLLRNAVNLSVKHADKDQRGLVRMQKQMAKLNLNRPTAAVETEKPEESLQVLLRQFKGRAGSMGPVRVVQGYDVHVYEYEHDPGVLKITVAPSSTRAENPHIRHWEIFNVFRDRDGWSVGTGQRIVRRVAHIQSPCTPTQLLHQALKAALTSLTGTGVEASAEALLHNDIHRPTPSDTLRQRLRRLGTGQKFTYKGHQFQISTYRRDDSCVVSPIPVFPNANNAENVEWDLYENFARRGPEMAAWLQDKGPLSAVPHHNSLRPKVDTGRRPGRNNAATMVYDEKQWIDETEPKTDKEFIQLLLKRSEPLLRGHGFYVREKQAVAATEPKPQDQGWLQTVLKALDAKAQNRIYKLRVTGKDCTLRFDSPEMIQVEIDDKTVVWFLSTGDDRATARGYVKEASLTGVGQVHGNDKKLWESDLDRNPQHLIQRLVAESVKLIGHGTAHAAAEPHQSDKVPELLQSLCKQLHQKPHREVNNGSYDIAIQARKDWRGKYFMEVSLVDFPRSSDLWKYRVYGFAANAKYEYPLYQVCQVSDGAEKLTRILNTGRPLRSFSELLKDVVRHCIERTDNLRGVTATTEHTDLNDMSLWKIFEYLYRKSNSKPADVKMPGHRCHIRFTDAHSCWVRLDDSDRDTVLFSVDNMHHIKRGPEPVLRMHLNGTAKQQLLWQSELPRNPLALMQRMVAESVKFLETRGATAAAEPDRASEHARAAYQALVVLSPHKATTRVLGAQLQVVSSSITESHASVLIRVTQGSDSYTMRLRASTYAERISVDFDILPSGKHRKTFYVPGNRLKPDQVQTTVTEVVRACGLHAGAHSAIVKLNQHEIEQCAKSLGLQLLREIGDRAADGYDEDDNTPLLSDAYSYKDLDPASVALTLKLARLFYTQAAPAITKFVETHGQQYLPKPSDIGYYIAQYLRDNSIGFQDMNPPARLDDSEAWDELMDELHDASRAIAGHVHYADADVFAGQVHLELHGNGGVVHAAAEPLPRVNPKNADDVVQELCRRCHGKPIGDDEFDIGPFHEDIGTMTVRVFRARNEENRNPKHFSVGVYLFNEQLDLEPEIRIQDRGDVTAAMQELLRIHNAVRALAKAAPDPERFRAAVIRYGQELERGHGEYGQDPSNNWAVELAGFWRRLRRA